MAKEEKTGMVIEIDREYRAKLKELQGKLSAIRIDRTMSQLASECVQAGIDIKLLAIK